MAKRPSQTPVFLVYAVTMLISLVVFGFAALVLLDVFVTQPKLEREAAADRSDSADEEYVEPDYSAARETILFIGAEGTDINAMSLIRVLPDEPAIKIVPVSPYTWTQVSGTEGTVASLFNAGAMSYLKQGVENALGVTVDKYIKISNEGWKKIVESLGGTDSYTFPQELYYRNEETGEITSFAQGPATRILYGDDIRKIMIYPLYENGSSTRQQVVGELSVALINSACRNNSKAVISNIQSIFNTIYNNSDTDITSKSFGEIREAYEHLIGSSSSPATYRLPSGSWDSRGYFIAGESCGAELAEYFETAEETSVLE